VAYTIEQEAEENLFRYCRERGAQMRPDDPVWNQLSKVSGSISALGSKIRQLERENTELKAEVKRLKGL
jgi:predicted RNase H-like nuclease (RuvC/YqgF family)